MKLFKRLFISFLLVIFLSCERCPSGEKIGNAHFSITSLDYLPYSGNEILRFKSINDNIIELSTDGIKNENSNYTVDTSCRKPSLLGNSHTYNYVDMEYKKILFYNDSILLQLDLYFDSFWEVENLSDIDSNYVETARSFFRNKLDNEESYFSIITNLRGKILISESQNNYQNSINYYNSRIIADTLFTNVYSDTENNFFYTKENGIVGFVNKGIDYRLKNIE